MVSKKRLSEIALLQRGLTYNKGDEVPSSSKIVLRSNNIDLDSHSLDLSELKYLREDFVIPEDRKVKKDSIFICMSNGSKQHVGKVAFIDRDMDYAFGGFMGLIIPKPSISAKYVFYACNSSSYRTFLSQIGNGIGITNLRFSELEKFEIPVPSIEEQQRIVDELDLLSGIIDKKNAQLRDLDALAQSIFYEMFGDPVTNEKGWPTAQLSSVSTLFNGRAYKQDELLSTGKYRVLRVGNFFTNSNYYYSDLELEDDKYCDNGDLLFAWSASFGAFIWSGEKVIYHYHIWKVLFDNAKLNKEFYRFLLNTMTSSFLNDVHGIGMVHLTKAGMEQYILPIPPMEKQEEFANKIASIEKQRTVIQASLDNANQLLTSRMSFYFE